MSSILIKNGTLVNQGRSFKGDILIIDNRIAKIFDNNDSSINQTIKDNTGNKYTYIDSPVHSDSNGNYTYNGEICSIIDAEGLFVIPGIIDDQVHFREPGATHKGDIESESAAAVLGGVTSYMDMPNNNPPAITIEAIKEKERIADHNSYANYSFYLGATNNNIAEILSANPTQICGVKVFMGSSTGDMLVDDEVALEKIFAESPILIATHCESESIIRENLELAIQKYGEDAIPVIEHPNIRSREACIESTKRAIALAKKYNSRLHILHISTKEEVELIKNSGSNRITGEVCVHYLILDDTYYNRLGSKIKCNPAIKSKEDREAILKAVKEGVIKVVATDHAPHTLQEKENSYLKSPSGLPLVQHSLQLMMEMRTAGVFTIEEIVERMCHSPALNFGVKERGFLREGYFADITIVDPAQKYNMLLNRPQYKCGWTPFEDMTFGSTVVHTIVNGTIVVSDSKLTGAKCGQKLLFDR
jgi:dihydroorotase, multifunctional complex type